MTYKTILVHVSVEKGAADPVPAALCVGDRFDATVIGLGAAAWDPYVDPTLGYVHAATITLLRQDIGADVKAAEARFRAACRDYRHPIVWRSSLGYPTRMLIDQGWRERLPDGSLGLTERARFVESLEIDPATGLVIDPGRA